MENISYFRNALNNEIIRLEYLSEKWHENFLNGTIPEEESGIILTVIGQTKLLIKKKFKQFHDLIEICEKNDSDVQKVTLEDLQGFWDVITIEIKKINREYNILEEKESNEWNSISQSLTGSSQPSTGLPVETSTFNINQMTDSINQS